MGKGLMSERPGNTRELGNDTSTTDASCSCLGCFSSLVVFVICGVLIEALGITPQTEGVLANLVFGLAVLALLGMAIFTFMAASKPRSGSVMGELCAMPYEEYLRSPHWKRKREERLRTMGYRCQICNRSASETQLDVHHRTRTAVGLRRGRSTQRGRPRGAQAR